MLIVLVGASGVGKSSLIECYAKQSSGQPVRLLTSTTTRLKRDTDLIIGDTPEYEYVGDTAFERLAQDGKFLKLFGDYGNRYGTKLEYLEDERVWGNRAAYFAVLLIEGALSFYHYALENGHAEASIRFVYLDMKDESERMRRLSQRGERDPKRFKPQLDDWRKRAEQSGIPFIYLDVQRYTADESAHDLYYRIFGPGRTEA